MPDLYSTWLHVPPGPRPPDYYALLRLAPFCDDVELIEFAVQRQMERLDTHALHPDPAKREACQSLMNEVARARTTLVSEQRRAEYDRGLSARREAEHQQPPTAGARPPEIAMMKVRGMVVPTTLVPSRPRSPEASALPAQEAAPEQPIAAVKPAEEAPAAQKVPDDQMPVPEPQASEAGESTGEPTSEPQAEESGELMQLAMASASAEADHRAAARRRVKRGLSVALLTAIGVAAVIIGSLLLMPDRLSSKPEPRDTIAQADAGDGAPGATRVAATGPTTTEVLQPPATTQGTAPTSQAPIGPSTRSGPSPQPDPAPVPSTQKNGPPADLPVTNLPPAATPDPASPPAQSPTAQSPAPQPPPVQPTPVQPNPADAPPPPPAPPAPRAPAAAPLSVVVPQGTPSVVFVCDGSGSMFAKAEEVRQALAQAINNLPADVIFEVIVSGEPRPASAFAGRTRPATEANKQQAIEAINAAQFQGAPSPQSALEMAARLKPAQITILTDERSPDLRPLLRSLNRSKTMRINVALVQLADHPAKPAAAEMLKAIAQENGGQFKLGTVE